jgi:hypothetical protein
MATPYVCECDCPEGVSKFVLWKCILKKLLEETNVWYLMETKVTLFINSKDLVEFKKIVANEK